MFLVPNKVRALATLFSSFTLSSSFSSVLSRAFAPSGARAFFLAKPLQLAGMSVASGTATLIAGSLTATVFKKVKAISPVICANPEGFR